MNMNPMNNWNATTVSVFAPGASQPVSVAALELSFTDSPSIVAFVTSTGAMWVGVEQDYYVEDNGSLIGVKITSRSRFVRWSESATFAGQATAGISNNSDLTNFLDNQVQLSDLQEEVRQRNRLIAKSQISDCFADAWFCASAELSSDLAMIRITSASIETLGLRLGIENQTNARSGEVWIDLSSKEVVQATEGGNITFTQSTGN